jgi:hypothetical protein
MKITIAVDAQPFFSALLGGAARKIFFDPRFKFITTDFTLSEFCFLASVFFTLNVWEAL